TYSLDLADTASWRMLPGTAPLGSRQFPTSVYDPDNDRMLLCGGVFGDSYGFEGVRADVWAFDFGSEIWQEIRTVGTPEVPYVRANHAVAIGTSPPQMVVLGGYRDNGALAPMNDVWALDLLDQPEWRQLLPSGAIWPSRQGHVAAIDDVSGTLAEFGG